MARILTTVHLSDIQKEIMAKVKVAPTEQVAWEEISKAASDIDQNFASARDMLGNLGLLYVGDGELSVTDKGEKVMQDENLVDETGELTDDGLALADIERAERPEQPEAPPNGLELPGDEVPPPEGIEDFPAESFQLLRAVNEDVKANEYMKALKKN